MAALLLRIALGVALCAALVCLAGGVAVAGPVATFHLEDGRTLSREIVDFGDEVFTLRGLDGSGEYVVAEEDAKSIDFGPIPIELGPGGAIIMPDGPEGLECLWWAVNGRHFVILGKTCYIERFLEGPERIVAFERELGRRIENKTLSSEVVRDMRLARVEVLYALGNGAMARAGLQEVRQEYAGDEIVEAFVKSILSRATSRRQRGESSD